MSLITTFMMISIMMFNALSHAQDLGTRGPTYPISEPDLLLEIQNSLRDKAKSGELDKLIKQMKERAVNSVKQPVPIAGLTKTSKPTTRYFDPTIEVTESIRDANGKLIAPAGTRRNPLEIVSMTRQLLFFDARDADQRRYAKAVVDRLGLGVKPILTGGSYLDLMKEWSSQVYYDQQGTLTTRLGVKQVPAIVRQEGMLLRIDEVKL